MHSQSSANRVPEDGEACEQSFSLAEEVFSAWAVVAAAKKNAAARRIAITDFVDLDKRFMVKSPFLIWN